LIFEGSCFNDGKERDSNKMAKNLTKSPGGKITNNNSGEHEKQLTNKEENYVNLVPIRETSRLMFKFSAAAEV
jgi:hypothetical protein